MEVDHGIKVIGLDMDGTLLRDDKTISKYTEDILKKAIEKGIYVLPATGRVHIGIPECIRKMDGVQYGICSNGASVLNLLTGEELYSCRISNENALKMIDIMEEYDTIYDAYVDGSGYSEERFYYNLPQYKIEPEMEKMYLKTRTPITNLREFLIEGSREVEKFNMFFAEPEQRLQAIEAIRQIPYVKVTSSLYNNIEINAANCNKGTALIGFAEKMGFTSDQVMGFGDGDNDYEMIVMSGIGVAMANGLDSVKKAADYITVTNEEDGVAKAIEHFCL